MKRIVCLLFCLLMALALAACKKPFGQTPYESVSPDDPPTFTEEDTDPSNEDEASDSSVPADDRPVSDDNDGEGNIDGDTPVSGDQTNTTAGSQGNAPDYGDEDDDEDDDGLPAGNTAGPGATTTAGSGATTAANGRTTTKAQPGQVTTTTRRAATTAVGNQDSGEDDDNTADLDWGNLTTTAKPGVTTTTAKPPVTTTTTKAPTTTVKPGTQVLPKAGDSVHEYLELGNVSVNLSKNTGTMVVKNISRGYETEQTKSCLIYTCYDKKGKSLGDVRINIGRINAGKESDPIAFTLPEDTYSMVFTESQVEFWTDGFH